MECFFNFATVAGIEPIATGERADHQIIHATIYIGAGGRAQTAQHHIHRVAIPTHEVTGQTINRVCYAQLINLVFPHFGGNFLAYFQLPAGNPIYHLQQICPLFIGNDAIIENGGESTTDNGGRPDVMDLGIVFQPVGQSQNFVIVEHAIGGDPGHESQQFFHLR